MPWNAHDDRVRLERLITDGLEQDLREDARAAAGISGYGEAHRRWETVDEWNNDAWKRDGENRVRRFFED
jgi:hypothetical protein